MLELGQPEFAAARAAAINLQRAAPRPIEATAPWLTGTTAKRPASIGGVHGTTQVVAGDSEGNMAALITTIGADFGSVVGVPGTGIVLNNSMVNYDPRPGRSNSIAPGKMPFFAVPAIVAARDGRAAFAAAGSGGYAILAGVISTIVGVVDHGLGGAGSDRPSAGPLAGRPHIHRLSGRVRPTSESRAARPPAGRAAGHARRVAVQPRQRGQGPEPGSLTAGAGPAWNTAAGGL